MPSEFAASASILFCLFPCICLVFSPPRVGLSSSLLGTRHAPVVVCASFCFLFRFRFGIYRPPPFTRGRLPLPTAAAAAAPPPLLLLLLLPLFVAAALPPLRPSRAPPDTKPSFTRPHHLDPERSSPADRRDRHDS